LTLDAAPHVLLRLVQERRNDERRAYIRAFRVELSDDGALMLEFVFAANAADWTPPEAADVVAIFVDHDRNVPVENISKSSIEVVSLVNRGVRVH
jgi:hypothetical protein